MRQYWKAFWRVYPAPVVFTAAGVAATWGATGYRWPVAATGAVLTSVVRLRLDPIRWGDDRVE